MSSRTSIILGIVALVLVIGFGAFVIGQKMKEEPAKFRLRIGDNSEIIVK